MYLDIDANDNLPAPAMATFKSTGAGNRISAVRLHLAGAWQWCAITGWADGPVAAWVTPIEESGDGPARLLHGGPQGLRLARIDQPQAAGSVPRPRSPPPLPVSAERQRAAQARRVDARIRRP